MQAKGDQYFGGPHMSQLQRRKDCKEHMDSFVVQALGLHCSTKSLNPKHLLSWLTLFRRQRNNSPHLLPCIQMPSQNVGFAATDLLEVNTPWGGQGGFEQLKHLGKRRGQLTCPVFHLTVNGMDHCITKYCFCNNAERQFFFHVPLLGSKAYIL